MLNVPELKVQFADAQKSFLEEELANKIAVAETKVQQTNCAQ